LGSLTESQIYNPDWSELGHIRPNRAQILRKHGLQVSGLILHSFYVQLLLINLISSLN